MITVAFGIPLDHATERPYVPNPRVDYRTRRTCVVQMAMMCRSQAGNRRRSYRIAEKHRAGLQGITIADDLPALVA